MSGYALWANPTYSQRSPDVIATIGRRPAWINDLQGTWLESGVNRASPGRGSVVPSLTAQDAAFAPIVARAARLICTTPEFDALAQEVGLASHPAGATDPAERARLRAELDGLIAHLYGLNLPTAKAGGF